MPKALLIPGVTFAGTDQGSRFVVTVIRYFEDLAEAACELLDDPVRAEDVVLRTCTKAWGDFSNVQLFTRRSLLKLFFSTLRDERGGRFTSEPFSERGQEPKGVEPHDEIGRSNPGLAVRSEGCPEPPPGLDSFLYSDPGVVASMTEKELKIALNVLGIGAPEVVEQSVKLAVVKILSTEASLRVLKRKIGRQDTLSGLHLLPFDLRSAVFLADLMNFTCEEIAEILDRSIQRVSSCLEMGRMQLKEHLRVSASTPAAKPPAVPPDSTGKLEQAPAFMGILNELNVNQDQLQKRQKLVAEIERYLSAKYGCPNRLMTYIMRFGHSRTSMHTGDIPHLETVLNSITGAEQINLVVHSPGGDGTIIEKIVDICRSHLAGANRKLRVIVPNVAKSAATILALGTDEIIMGYTSELGPIDPQVPIVVSGMTQWISAFAFIEARNKLMKQVKKATKKKESTVGLLTQLACLDIPFTHEMENQIGFAKKTAVTLLNKYMLAPVHKNGAERKKKAEAIAQKLLSKQSFPIHGYYINGQTAKKMGLQVELLDKDDPLWKLIWDYYMRCEVQMNLPLQPGQIKTKLFESGNEVSLVIQDAP